MWEKKMFRHLDKHRLANNNLPKSTNAFAHIHEKDCENQRTFIFFMFND